MLINLENSIETGIWQQQQTYAVRTMKINNRSLMSPRIEWLPRLVTYAKVYLCKAAKNDLFISQVLSHKKFSTNILFSK
jgi:hypothetical protein